MITWLIDKLEVSHGHNNPMRSMEGLRGLAVFLVFWVHYSSLIKPFVSDTSLAVLHFVHSFGHLGVDLFFVLSGYLIYGTIISKSEFSIRRYSARRVQRIYPTFITVFVIYILLSYIFPSESKIPESAAEAAKYLLQNLLLLPGLFDIRPMITVAWSLSYEVFYYVTVPIAIFAFRLKRYSVDRRIVLWIVVAMAGFYSHFIWSGPARLLMFISGILLFELFVNKKVRLIRGGEIYLIASLALFGYSHFIDLNTTFLTASAFLLFLLFCLCALNPESKTYRWLLAGPLRWLGNMSYSYYLLHGLTLKFVFLIFNYVAPAGFTSNSIYYWLWIPVFVMTLITSFCLFLTIERPFSLSLSDQKGT